MVTIGLTVVTIVLAALAVRCNSPVKWGVLGSFWTGYAITALLFAGVL